MNIFFKKQIPLILCILFVSCSSINNNQNTTISIKTSLGDIKITLYDNTPVHRDNFIKLVNSSVYDGITFHRIIKDFMIQAGDPSTSSRTEIKSIDSLQTYTITAELNNTNFHKRGALAAARQGSDINPELRSSGTQFYIVQGVKYNDEELDQAEIRINSNIKQSLFNKLIKQTTDSISATVNPLKESEIQEIASLKMFKQLSSQTEYKILENHRTAYKTIGGTPRLDGTYTVFGEVIEGMDIVDKIASVPTDNNDKPLSDIRIFKVKIVKN